jgi:hypothetical protein
MEGGRKMYQSNECSHTAKFLTLEEKDESDIANARALCRFRLDDFPLVR